jgi:hypothetical protein
MRFIVRTIPNGPGDDPHLDELCDSLLEMLNSENPLDLCDGFVLKRVVAESVSDRNLLTTDDQLPLTPATWFSEMGS